MSFYYIVQFLKHPPSDLTLSSRQELTLQQSPQANQSGENNSVLILNLAICSHRRHEEMHEPETLTYSLQFSLVLGDFQCIKRYEELTKQKSSHMPQEEKLCALQVVQQLEKS